VGYKDSYRACFFIAMVPKLVYKDARDAPSSSRGGATTRGTA
jgi:hypothetical protein